MALIGFITGSSAFTKLLNAGFSGASPSFSPCHTPLKKPVIGFQYL